MIAFLAHTELSLNAWPTFPIPVFSASVAACGGTSTRTATGAGGVGAGSTPHFQPHPSIVVVANTASALI